MLRTVVIEDDSLARDALISMLESRSNLIEVVGSADSVPSGIEVLLKEKPDLLFLDIRLKKGTGFDILENTDISNLQIVFTTAYSQYAIQAIKYSALDYLLKPIDPEELNQTIDRISEQRMQSILPNLEVLKQMIASEQSPEKMVVSDSKGFEVIALNELVQIEGDKNYSTFYMVDGKKITTTKTLREYEKMLETPFMRVHKSHIINLNQVSSYKKGRGGEALMNDGSSIPISREKKDEFLKLIKEHLK